MNPAEARHESYVYIAAPFFNPFQIKFVEMLESAMTECGIPFYSPRLHATRFTPGDAGTKNDPYKTLMDNKLGIEHAGLMVAVLDFLTPPDIGTYLVKMPPKRIINLPPIPGTQPPKAEMKRIFLPDSGVSWEMGFASAYHVPVLGFVANPELAINLMLAMSTEGLVVGPSEAKMVWRLGFEAEIKDMFNRTTWKEFLDESHIKDPKQWRLI